MPFAISAQYVDCEVWTEFSNIYLDSILASSGHKVGAGGTFLASWLQSGRRCGCREPHTWPSALKYAVYSNIFSGLDHRLWWRDAKNTGNGVHMAFSFHWNMRRYQREVILLEKYPWFKDADTRGRWAHKRISVEMTTYLSVQNLLSSSLLSKI